MKTRDRILNCARQQFNLKGPGSVSVRDICNELAMSPGNFNYHFPSKDQLIVSLYRQMQEEIREVIFSIPGNPAQESQPEKLSILFFLNSHREIFKVQLRYKFLYLNLFEILSRHPEISSLYHSGNEFERQAALQLYRAYEAGGVLRPGVSDAELARLVEIGQVLHHTWPVDAELRYHGDLAQKEKFYLKMCCGLLEPYLAAGAQQEYRDFFENLIPSWPE